MQIRLTVVPWTGARPAAQGRAVPRDVLVTAPAGTALAAVASGLATAVAGGDGPVVVYAGADRLDAQRCTLGEPPLLDGAVLSLGAPADPGPDPSGGAAQLQVVAGPDAGGVHLLHGGQIRVGRSSGADVPLDDPDVSRLHCAVTVAPDGAVTVQDLGSTNGTTLDGAPIADRPVPLRPGALLRLGESTLRLAAPGETARPVPTTPDNEGHVRVPAHQDGAPREGRPGATDPAAGTHHAYGSADWGASGDTARTAGGYGEGGGPGAVDEGSGRLPAGPYGEGPGHRGAERRADGSSARGGRRLVPEQGGAPSAERTSPGYPNQAHDPIRNPAGTPPRGTELPRGARRRGGLSAWARRFGPGGRGEPDGTDERDGTDIRGHARETAPGGPGATTPADLWPDLAALLLTAIGPGPRLWERGTGHPEALAVRLGTTERHAPDGTGPLPAVPVTVGLREVGGLGLAGPRARLAGLARSVVAQLAALHAPEVLDIVLISTDRSRSAGERAAEWSWLGWLPHLRPTHGQDCRLLLAYDRDQAAARTAELLRLLEERAERGTAPGSADGARGPGEAPWSAPASYTVLVVDGDPGSASLREAVGRLCAEGGAVGIHVVCLAETDPATAASSVERTYETACAVSPVFRDCGAAALLSGDVATALRLLRVARGRIAGQGTVASVDAVSAAWAERFARALAPLRTEGSGAERHPRVSTPLPQVARLLDELGLARATPASLMARWAAAADDTEALGGRAWAVLGAGPRGPVCVDLAHEGPHLLAEGPTGSGRTELLRSVAASLAAAERPDRLAIVLIDGRDTAGGASGGTGALASGGASGPGDGLGVCTELPHVTTYLTANDPVRMREFAQSLTAELKRRAELLGRLGFADWHTQREVTNRMVAQRGGAADLDPPPSATLRLRPSASPARTDPGPPLPRLVVVVDDYDALLAPPLGSPGRPAAGSVVRALEAVARDGERLGVHLVAAAGRGERVAGTELALRAGLRIGLDAPGAGPEDPAPGRGVLRGADGRVTAFQAGRVTGRIPRTATLRPTVVALDWARMGDPPTRRPVRELGNGPTDLALLASALERAARSVHASEVTSLL
ncbi:FHA domain-containing protein [Streptomyces sp. NPDC058001]|uniref:FHA domain-containing protein n=1 Tax=Streptomyces sp. NPDC058001 TaxID=3346300 RepID=UPI0036EFC10A